jgi:pyruvate,phosphate dikinase
MHFEVPMFPFYDGLKLKADHTKEVLGGKGYALAVMSANGLPVPPGFTIPTSVCLAYMELSEEQRPSFMDKVAERAWDELEEVQGTDPHKPMLFSVRSGAPVSMPGMMDTILNVGLTPQNMKVYSKHLGRQTALDCFSRLMQMMGEVVFEISKEAFDTVKKLSDHTDPMEMYKGRIAGYVKEYDDRGLAFPADAKQQLRLSIEAVFKSWNNPRAVQYRDIHHIPHSMGTAVTVQRMVFGNLNSKSATGVAFSRNPQNGDPNVFGEWLAEAQGEDVVDGSHTPMPLDHMIGTHFESLYSQLVGVVAELEEQHKAVQDVEFTIEDGKLWILQTRTAKRTPRAAVIFALDMLGDNIFDTVEEMFASLTPKEFALARVPSIPADTPFNFCGLPVSDGVVHGVTAHSSAAAVKLAEKNLNVILVTDETTPDDLPGMFAAKGMLTRKGGATCHAAIVARSMNKPCVVGCPEYDFPEGSTITIDGATGRVYQNVVQTEGGGDFPEWGKLASYMSSHSSVTLYDGLMSHNRYVRVADYIMGDGLDKFKDDLDGMKPLQMMYTHMDFSAPAATVHPEDVLLLNSCGVKDYGPELAKYAKALTKAGKVDKCVLFGTEHVPSAELQKLTQLGWAEVKEIDTLKDATIAGTKIAIVPSKKFVDFVGEDNMAEVMQMLVAKGVSAAPILKIRKPIALAYEMLGEQNGS